MNSIKE